MARGEARAFEVHLAGADDMPDINLPPGPHDWAATYRNLQPEPQQIPQAEVALYLQHLKIVELRERAGHQVGYVMSAGCSAHWGTRLLIPSIH